MLDVGGRCEQIYWVSGTKQKKGEGALDGNTTCIGNKEYLKRIKSNKHLLIPHGQLKILTSMRGIETIHKIYKVNKSWQHIE